MRFRTAEIQRERERAAEMTGAHTPKEQVCAARCSALDEEEMVNESTIAVIVCVSFVNVIPKLSGRMDFGNLLFVCTKSRSARRVSSPSRCKACTAVQGVHKCTQPCLSCVWGVTRRGLRAGQNFCSDARRPGHRHGHVARGPGEAVRDPIGDRSPPPPHLSPTPTSFHLNLSPPLSVYAPLYLSLHTRIISVFVCASVCVRDGVCALCGCGCGCVNPLQDLGWAGNSRTAARIK
jgi:hypothetical protein